VAKVIGHLFNQIAWPWLRNWVKMYERVSGEEHDQLLEKYEKLYRDNADTITKLDKYRSVEKDLKKEEEENINLNSGIEGLTSDYENLKGYITQFLIAARQTGIEELFEKTDEVNKGRLVGQLQAIMSHYNKDELIQHQHVLDAIKINYKST